MGDDVHLVDGNFAYIGHMEAPHGTSVVDVADPRKPRIVAEIPRGLHSHKVRVANGIMLVNRERHGGSPGLSRSLIPRVQPRWAAGGLPGIADRGW